MIQKKCPKCGRKLSIFYIKPNCPDCGCDIAYYNIEEELEKDAQKAEEEFAQLEKLLRSLTSKKAIKIYIAIVCGLVAVALIAVGIFFRKSNSDIEKLRGDLVVSPAETLTATDNIHFLPTGSSDAILLESDGHFALVDCGEDSDNPRGFKDLELDGYEDYVLSYLKKIATAEDGKVYLDFVLGTHSHSDHIGGFDTIISDKDVVIDRAYLKVYDESKIDPMEVEEWDNNEVYLQMKNALTEKKVPIISDFEEPKFTLGNFQIILLNTEYEQGENPVGENDNAIGVLVCKKTAKIFLAADIDNKSGDEDRLKDQIGKIDVLKVGHHSYSGSTTKGWLETLNPDVCVVTNNPDSADKNTLRRITDVAQSPILLTGAENGVIVSIDDTGEISFFNDID